MKLMNRAVLLALLITFGATSVASADIGVVVTGEATLQPQLLSHLESWLKRRGNNVFSSALEPDAINTLIDCFVVEDLNCARSVIEARAKAETIVYARVEVAPANNGMRDISIVGYWMQKGHDTMAERRGCHHCTEKEMHGLADDLMLALAAQPPTGSHVHVPAESTTVAQVESPPPTVVAPVPTPLDDEQPSRVVPGVVMGIGAAAVITGGVLFAIDKEPSKTGPQPEWRTDRTVGAICMGAGAVAIGVGAWLWFHQGADSAPVASVSHDGAVVGWAGRF
jgi:hypothetical protein